MGKIGTYVSHFLRGDVAFAHVITAILLSYGAVYAIADVPVAAMGRVALMALVTLPVLFAARRKAALLLGDGNGQPEVWGLVLSGLALILTAATLITGFFLPPPPVALPEPLPPKAILRGDRIELSGFVDYRMMAELGVLLEDDSAPRLIEMTSEGGHVIAGRSIGLLIARHGRDTLANGPCYSACTLAFAGGTARRLGPKGALGFHGYRMDHRRRVQTLDIGAVEARDRAFLIAQGVSAGFVDRAYGVDPSDLWIPTRGELVQSGVLRPD